MPRRALLLSVAIAALALAATTPAAVAAPRGTASHDSAGHIGGSSASAGSAAARPARRAAPAATDASLGMPTGIDSPSPPSAAQCLALTGGRCVTPAQLQTLYGVTPLLNAGITGAGVTIAIVDSYGSPTIRADLAVYDAQYKLPALNLTIITPAGAPPAYNPSGADQSGWAGETTLDVEVVHSMAPGAHILLVETPTDETEGLAGFPDIITAENYVISHGLADVISQSFAATEQTFTGAAQVKALSQQVYPAAQAAGVTVLTATGDNGPTDLELDQKTLYDHRVIDWPASDPLVTAVGGTTLHIGADGQRLSPDSVWGGAAGDGAGNGGVSVVFPRPAFQASVAAVVGSARGVPDVSMDASPSSGLITYQSFDGSGWSVGGGTSQATPMFAGIVALADQAAHARVGYLNNVLYGTLAKSSTSGIVDVTTGTNALIGSDGTPNAVPAYAATSGYDLASGLGTIDAQQFVPALVAATHGQTKPLSATAAGGSGSVSPPSATATASTSSTGSPVPAPFAVTHASSTETSHPVRFAFELVALVIVVLVAVAIVVALVRRRRSAS